jgi:RHS repeat-associated protein
MSGISSKVLAFGEPKNKKKFNAIEQVAELDLNQYEAFYRNADPQIGRWWQIDPKLNMGESPYSMMGNNPILNTDPLGDTIRAKTGFWGLRKLKYDENTGKFYKKNGQEYTGNSKFVKAVGSELEKMNQTTNGAKVVKELSSAGGDFTFKNKSLGDGLQFKGT